MATTETLEQVLKLLIEDTKRYRQQSKESAARVDKALAELSEQTKKTQAELDALAQQVKETIGVRIFGKTDPSGVR